jgi:hypothetical protein
MKSINYAGVLGILILFLAVPGMADTILPTHDITENTGWDIFTLNGSSGQASSVVDPVQGNVLKLHYDLTYGSWVSMRSPYFSCVYSLAEKGRILSFDMKGDGSPDTVQLYIRDTSGQTYQSVTLSAGDSFWKTVDVPLDTLLWGQTAVVLDLRNIVDIGFLITSPSSSPATVAFRSLVVKNPPASVPDSLMIDHCDLAGANNINNVVSYLNNCWSTTTTAVAPLPGHTYCREITSPAGSLDGGIWEKLYYQGQPLNVTPYTHLSFYIRPSAKVNEYMGVILQDSIPSTSTRANFLKISDYQTLVPDQWQRVLIPVTDFAGPVPVSLTALDQFTLVIPSNNTVYLGEVSFESLTYTTQANFVLDAMDENYQAAASPWKVNAAPGASLVLSSVRDTSGPALQAQAYFITSHTISFSRTFGLNVKRNGNNALQFEYMGTGSVNNVEFKIEDRFNTVFRYTLSNASNTSGQWKTATAFMDQFSWFSSPDNKPHDLDFTNLTFIEFAVTKGNGGPGDTYFHHIRSAYVGPESSMALLDKLLPQSPEGSAMPNPFLPALGHSTAIKFTHDDSEAFSVKIFNLQGKPVRELQNSLVWDGRNNSGNLCEGGLYIYQVIGKTHRVNGRVVLLK